MAVLAITVILMIVSIFTRICTRWTIRKYTSSKASMKGKVVIITGANNGIGFEAAKAIAGAGARVILACRNEKKGSIARDDIVLQTGNYDVVFKKLDLSSFLSVRKFATDILETEERLDVLINNAGIYGLNDQYTEDNEQICMQTNYLGPFLLTHLLLPLLKKNRSSRIINVSSLLHFFGKIKLEVTKKMWSPYKDLILYCNSKLCLLMFTVELSRRLRGVPVVVNAVHPGVIMTGLGNNSPLITKVLYAILSKLCYRTVEEGAQTLIYLAIAEECGTVTGKYFVDCRESRMLGLAKNHKLATELWKLSEERVSTTDNVLGYLL